MKLFSCPHCGARIFFENSVCLACGTPLLYDPASEAFIRADAPGAFTCVNAEDAACNWRAPAQGAFCRACELNKTIPNLSQPEHRHRWRRIELAKRRLVYELLAFGLEVRPKRSADDEAGIAFDFLADDQGGGPGGERILTGHDNGLITLNIAEADHVERERMRVAMDEPYRTLLGHFRHEIGHFYWDRLFRENEAQRAAFRELFGDDRADYGEALQRHYANPPAADWPQHFISTYATSHPWEDWAETWAHYLHIVDTLEMACALDLLPGLVAPASPADSQPSVAARLPQRVDASFDEMLKRWLELSVAANSINRCMGLRDAYPFIISDGVAEKLRFIDRLLRDLPAARPSGEAGAF